MKKTLTTLAITSILLSACGGGGSNSTSSTGNSSSITTGFVLPTEISAVPAEPSATTGVQINSFASIIQALTVAQLPATSDYKTATTQKYIEERELEQFDIIEQVLNALGQTHYADAVNINAGPYKAMVAWTDDEDGREVKTLEPWVIDSKMIVENGVNVNRVLAWIEETEIDESTGTPEVELIKGEFKIYKSATLNADGSFADYGDWDMNVSFGEPVNGQVIDFFVASARTDSDGVTTLQINDRFQEEVGENGDVLNIVDKGILVRSGTTGRGKVQFTDFESCWQQGASFPACAASKTAQYAYNATHLVVDGDIGNGTTDAVYKERNPAKAVEMTHRYGLYHAEAGTDSNGDPIAAGDSLEKHKSFGFPVVFTGNSNNTDFTEYAYYGAWQGRHELWGGQNLTAGTTVTKETHDPSVTAPTYVVSQSFNGTLTRRNLVNGDLSDIQGINVETYTNEHYDLTHNGTEWRYCDGWMDWSGGGCTDFATNTGNQTLKSFTALLDSLVVTQGDRKWVWIGRWDGSQDINYVYLNSDPGVQGFTAYSSPGFYTAVQDNQTGQMAVDGTSTLYTPSATDQMYVDIGGSIYIQYTGIFDDLSTPKKTGWVQKTLTDFDQQTWTPTFSSTDIPFDPERDAEYYINNNGANYVVRRLEDLMDSTAGPGPEDYEVKTELQSAANPVNISSILPDNTSYLATPWQPEVQYTFVTTAGANFMKLIYANDDQSTNVDETGTVVTDGQWGLQAYNVSDQPLKSDGTTVAVDAYGFPDDPNVRPTEFNWEYSVDDGWGTQRFLCTLPDCVTGSYVILSDPVQLLPLSSGTSAGKTIENGAGDAKTLSLQYDGWMHGLPDLYFELQKNNWQMSTEIKNKVINIPVGTSVTDGDGVEYYIKPLEISVFLNVVTLTEITDAGGVAPIITTADSLILDNVPGFTDHGMGPLPTDTVVKYSEGVLVE